MSICVPRMLLGRFLPAVLMLGVLFAADARADLIDDGDLFGVFATDGEFSDDGLAVETYTIIHFTNFGPSEFPDGLVPEFFPSGPFNPQDLFAPDAEFFLIGGLTGNAETGASNHLMLSNSTGQVGAGGQLGDPLHDILLAGAFGLVDEANPIRDMNAATFWALFGDSDAQADALDFFFDPAPGFGQGPINTLDSYNFQGGSEDLFGFDPVEVVGYLTGNGHIGNFSFTNGDGDTYSVPPVPEPGSLVLFGSALAAGWGVRRRRRRAA